MADKYLRHNAGGLAEREASVVSVGAADAGKIGALDGTGRFDNSFMPVGLGADTSIVVASEALSAGDVVNKHDVAGGFRARKADASANKPVHGFVLAAVVSGGNATVHRSGSNTQVTGQTPGTKYLSTTPGAISATAPTVAGQISQEVGVADSATSFSFRPQLPVLLA